MGLSFDGIDVLRLPAPLTPAELGSGGRWSSGETRPPTRDGLRPGWDEDRLLPGTIPMGAAPGKEDAALGWGMEPADAVESAGDDDRELGGADDFVVRRWKIVPWVVVELMICDWPTISERVVD